MKLAYSSNLPKYKQRSQESHDAKTYDPATHDPETHDPETHDPATRDPETCDPKEARVQEARGQTGRAPGREREEISGDAVAIKKKEHAQKYTLGKLYKKQTKHRSAYHHHYTTDDM